MIPRLSPSDASVLIKKGGIVIYPTEGIYGLGCDPFNEKSVSNVFAIKGRAKHKNFIIICSDTKYLTKIINKDYLRNKDINSKSFVTWIVPSNKICPIWLCDNSLVAVRVTNHPTIKQLCENLNGPIISTSANYSNKEYVNNLKIIEDLFDSKIDCIVEGKLGKMERPSVIKNIVTNEILRK